MIKLIKYLFAILVLILGAFYYLAYTGFAEPRGMSRNGLSARMIIPKPLRVLDVGETCEPVEYARWLQECGGICGQSFEMSWGTPLLLEEVQAMIDLEALRAALDSEPIKLDRRSDDPRASPGCPITSMVIYIDYRQIPETRDDAAQ